MTLMPDVGEFVITDLCASTFLLPDAKTEIKKVCANARRLLNKSSNEEISRSDLINYFVEPLLDGLRSSTVRGLAPEDRLTGADIIGFIKTLMVLSATRSTPTKLFDRPNDLFFSGIRDHVDQKGFTLVMKGLQNSQSNWNGCSVVWDAPFKPDLFVRQAEKAFTAASSAIAYIRNVTILSTDDDQYRCAQYLAEKMGLKRIKNPKKAFGPVSTNSVSLVTSTVLGLRLMRKGETLTQVVQTLFKWMQNVDLDDQVKGTTIVALDRGYLNKTLIKWLLQCGFEIIGTHPRAKGFAFFFWRCRGIWQHIHRFREGGQVHLCRDVKDREQKLICDRIPNGQRQGCDPCHIATAGEDSDVGLSEETTRNID